MVILVLVRRFVTRHWVSMLYFVWFRLRDRWLYEHYPLFGFVMTPLKILVLRIKYVAIVETPLIGRHYLYPVGKPSIGLFVLIVICNHKSWVGRG